MEQYLDMLFNSKVFKGLNKEEISKALGCLDAKVKKYLKNETIFNDGDQTYTFAIVLEGELSAEKIDYEGNKNIVSKFNSNSFVGLVACFSSSRKIPFEVKSIKDSKLLFLDSRRITTICFKSCDFHKKILSNIITILADKNNEFTRKIDVLTKRTIREKVLTFLLQKTNNSFNQWISIDMSKTQIAEFLSVNRSALVRELKNMKDKGIIDYNKNNYKLL